MKAEASASSECRYPQNGTLEEGRNRECATVIGDTLIPEDDGVAYGSHSHGGRVKGPTGRGPYHHPAGLPDDRRPSLATSDVATATRQIASTRS